MNSILLTFVLCLPIVLRDAPLQDTTLMRVAIAADPAGTELVATRNTTDQVHYWRPPGYDNDVPYRTIEDTIEVALAGPERDPVVLWSKSKRTDWCLDMEDRMERLVFYDAFYDETVVWVLYAIDRRVLLDRVTRNDDGTYGIAKTINVATLVRASLRPYVIEAGKVVSHGDSVVVATYLSSYRAHNRQDPYVFVWIDDDSATEVEDTQTTRLLRERTARALADKDRPRMSEQIRPREVNPAD